MIIGVFRRNPINGVCGHTFLEKKPEIFRFITLPLGILDKTKLYPCEFREIVLHRLEIPRPKMKTDGNSTWYLQLQLDQSWKFHFFFRRFLNLVCSLLLFHIHSVSLCFFLNWWRKEDSWIFGERTKRGNFQRKGGRNTLELNYGREVKRS